MRAAGRNAPCPCGSGKKYKHCCGLPSAAAAGAASVHPAMARHAAPAIGPGDIGALVALVNAGALEEAERRARALLTNQHSAGILWKILSVTLMRQNKDALQELRKTVELLPDDAEAHGNLGAALNDRGQWVEALPSLRRALAIDPQNAEVLLDAADACTSLGRPDEALPLYQRALARNPASLQARNNLGLALASLGRREEAVACYERVLALEPRHAEALDNLGNVLRELGQGNRAESLHRRALEIDPRSARSHYCLGTALFERRRVDEAAASFRAALALEPLHVPAHLGLAAALRQARRVSEAEPVCEAALVIAPRSAEALSLLGELRADRGRLAEAEELLQKAIEVDPGYPLAYCSLAQHRKMTAADTGWLRGVEALLARRPPLANEIGLRYALGKYFDDLRRYDEAFAQYRQANELTKHIRSPYDGEQLTRHVDRLIATFDAAVVRARPGRGASSERFVFVTGMPRSGTSLAEQILASHPAVFGAGEVAFWDRAFRMRANVDFSGAGGAAAIDGVASDYLARMQDAGPEALRVIDKLPANFLYAGLIHAAFPRARIIHMRRHPLDTCLSIYFQNFFHGGAYANDLEHLAHYYGEYVRITAHWLEILPASAYLEVPYEALIADQEHWTRRMLEFVDLPWDPRCLDFHRAERIVITPSKWQVREPVNAASVGRWRNYQQYVGPLESLLRKQPLAIGIDGTAMNEQAGASLPRQPSPRRD